MNEYFTDTEQANYVDDYESSVDSIVRKSSVFEMRNVIEVESNDLFNQVPNKGENLFLRLDFDNNCYQVLIASEQPADTIQISDNSYLLDNEQAHTISIDGKQRTIILRIVN